jgi:hypothetical protein
MRNDGMERNIPQNSKAPKREAEAANRGGWLRHTTRFPPVRNGNISYKAFRSDIPQSVGVKSDPR